MGKELSRSTNMDMNNPGGMNTEFSSLNSPFHQPEGNLSVRFTTGGSNTNERSDEYDFCMVFPSDYDIELDRFDTEETANAETGSTAKLGRRDQKLMVKASAYSSTASWAELENKQFEFNQKWHVISLEWFNKWRAYVKFDDDDDKDETDEAAQGKFPGAIDNSSLQGDDPKKLKSNINKGTDYVLIIEKTAAQLYSIYGGGPKFVRPTVLHNSNYLHTLKANGLDVFVYQGAKEVFVLIKAPLARLQDYADESRFVMKLDPMVLSSKGFNISSMPEVTKYEPYEYIYARYTKNVPESLYWRDKSSIDPSHPFRDLVRLQLTSMLIEKRPSLDSQELKIARYLKYKFLSGFFPLHNLAKRTQLRTTCLTLTWKFWENFPRDRIEDLKEYFGQKIALLNLFIVHYSAWLSAPALIGIPLQIAVFASGNYSFPYLPVYSFLIAIWAILMLEYWKRSECTAALIWGTSMFEETEVIRAEFRGETIDSYIDGRKMRFYPNKKRKIQINYSIAAIFGLSCLVVGIVASIYYLQFYLLNKPTFPNSDAQTLASILNAIQIQIANYVYGMAAEELNRLENHRTATNYEDSFTVKLFCFQFVNSFASFFYLAFVTKYLTQFDPTTQSSEPICSQDVCMQNLATNLGIIFGTRLVSGLLLNVLVPYVFFKHAKNQVLREDEKKGVRATRPEIECALLPVDDMAYIRDHYSELAIQFGYQALFVTALPMASTFALFSTWINMKADIWKLLHINQRPVPRAAEDIGAWIDIFTLMSVAAVVTNGGLAVFTMDATDQYQFSTRLWLFITFQWSCFSLQVLVMSLVPNVPDDVQIQVDRTEFLVSRVIEGEEDKSKNEINTGDVAFEFQSYEYGDASSAAPVVEIDCSPEHNKPVGIWG